LENSFLNTAIQVQVPKGSRCFEEQCNKNLFNNLSETKSFDLFHMTLLRKRGRKKDLRNLSKQSAMRLKRTN